MRKGLLWTIIAASFALFTYLLVTLPWHDALATLSRASWTDIVVYLAASFAIKLLLGIRWQIILRAKGIRVPFRSVLAYRFASNAVSFVTPGPRVGGEAVAAGLLSKHRVRGKRIKMSKALGTLFLDHSVELQTFAAMFFIGVLTLSALHDIPEGLQLLLVGTSSVLLVLMLVFAINVRFGRPFISRIASRFRFRPRLRRELRHFEIAITSFYREDRRDFLFSHVASTVAWLLSIVEYDALLRVLGLHVPLYGIFIVYSFVGLAYIVPVPLALGSLEGGQIAAFALIGLPGSAGVLLALLTRLRDVLFTIIGFMVLVYHGFTPRPAS